MKISQATNLSQLLESLQNVHEMKIGKLGGRYVNVEKESLSLNEIASKMKTLCKKQLKESGKSELGFEANEKVNDICKILYDLHRNGEQKLANKSLPKQWSTKLRQKIAHFNSNPKALLISEKGHEIFLKTTERPSTLNACLLGFNVEISKNITQGDRAIDFARSELLKHPEVAKMPIPYVSNYKPPLNPEIELLAKLHRHVHRKNLLELMKKHRKDPWNHQDVLKAADAMMKVGYAISRLTLDETPEVTRQNPRRANVEYEATNRYTLIRQDNFSTFATVQFCHLSYTLVKGTSSLLEDHKIACPNENYRNKFYTEGTLQSQWRDLANDISSRTINLIEPETLGEELQFLRSDEKAL